MTLALPPDTVQFYNDGGGPPKTPLLQEAERAYRESYLAGAREVLTWDMPDPEVIDEAWQARKRARRAAEVFVPSSFMLGDPSMDSEHVDNLAEHVIAELAGVLPRSEELNRHEQCSVEMMLVPRGVSSAYRQRPVKLDICMMCRIRCVIALNALSFHKRSCSTLSRVAHKHQHSGLFSAEPPVHSKSNCHIRSQLS